MNFVHLHVHSEYSLLDSVCRVPDLVKEAKALGFQAIALTDRHVMHGAIPFYRLCTAAGIKPIIGMEVVLSDSAQHKKNTADTPPDTMLLLAKNETGYRHLVALSTQIQQEGTTSLTMKDVCSYQEGLILLLSATTGKLADLLLKGMDESALDYLKAVQTYFKDNVYLEIQDHNTASEKECMKRITVLAKETGIQQVASNRVHYIKQDQAAAHRVLNGIRDGEKFENATVDIRNEQFYLKTGEQMTEIFHMCPEAITNSVRIAEQCQLSFSFDRYRLPKYHVPDQWETKQYLEHLTTQGMNERYPHADVKVIERLKHELYTIDAMGFNDYFLIVWDLIRHAKNSGIRPGPGRGSAAGSIVSYCLGITDVDPIKHQLLFERFLNPERVSMPDIDIDFPDKDRDAMIHYVCEKYGKNHAAQIITFGTLAAKAAIRDVGRVLNLPTSTIDKVAKNISTKHGTLLKEALKHSKQLQEMASHSDDVKQLLELAGLVEGLPRHRSIHAAGIVISEDPLTDWVPLQEGRDGIALTQYPMEDLEALGLLKMDFLGLRNLTLLESMVQLISETSDHSPDLDHLPEEDLATFQLLSEGDTTGIFQLESHGMREVLKQLKPTTFEDIVAVNALFRPGPMQFIKHFIEGKHAPDQVVYPHPDLKPILSRTYGVIVYQEQIMEIASKMANFSLGQADILRRAVSKKKRDVLEQQRENFVNGCLQNGYDQNVADPIYKLIVRFADFGFNRSHAVAYSLISYRFAYLKAHFPHEFMISLLSSVIHHHEKIAEIVNECKRKGIRVQPPSVNDSGANFIMRDQQIFYALAAIKNVGQQAAQEILATRENGPFNSLYDFCQRVSLKKVNRRAIESLIFAGALDVFNQNRAVLLASLERLIDLLEKEENTKNADQTKLLDDEEPEAMYMDVPPFTLKEQLQFEKEALGMYLSTHPIDAFQHVVTQHASKTIATAEKESLHKVRAALFVEKCQQIKTKKGQLMAFLQVSDQTGQAEAIVFPSIYEKQRNLFQEGAMIFTELTMQSGENESKWIIQKAVALTTLKKKSVHNAKIEQRVYLQIDEEHLHPEMLWKVKQILEQHRGTAPVILHYRSEKRTIKLSSDFNIDPSDTFLKVMERLIGQGNVMIRSR